MENLGSKLPAVRSIAWLDLVRSMQSALPCCGLSVGKGADRYDPRADAREEKRGSDDVVTTMLPVMANLDAVIVDSNPNTERDKQECEHR